MPSPTDVLVIGAGPAGLMAAIAAAETGARVTILERMPRPGVKLLTTGGGRCNLTNTLPLAEFLARFGKQGKFMRPAFDAFDAPALRSFFHDMGVDTHCADGFHVFPVAESARVVRDALVSRCRDLKVEVITETNVLALHIQEATVRGVETANGCLPATTVILAAGGCAYPDLGSNGSGFALAQGAGHTIVSPVPALVPLITQQEWPRRCTGIVLTAVRLRIDLPKASRAGVTGDLLFTHRGLSGPAAIDLSGEVARRLAEGGNPVPLRLHLTAETNPEVWADRIEAKRLEHPRRFVRSLVAEYLPHTLANELSAEIGIADDLRAAHLPRSAARQLAEWLAGVPVTITATEGFKKAMVSSGGVSTREIDPRTLQSRLVAGLYLAGEILDIDGPCGGYNLQWAFSSGHLAGRAAAQSLK